MKRNNNPLVRTIERGVGSRAKILFKLGNYEEMVETEILGVSESGLMVILTHPEPFLNTSIMERNVIDGKVELLPKLVKQMLVPINNIIAFKLV